MFELTPERVEELVRRAAAGALTEEDREIVCSRLRTWRRAVDLLSQEGTTIDDLREVVLGSRGKPSPSVRRDGTRVRRRPQSKTALATGGRRDGSGKALPKTASAYSVRVR